MNSNFCLKCKTQFDENHFALISFKDCQHKLCGNCHDTSDFISECPIDREIQSQKLKTKSTLMSEKLPQKRSSMQIDKTNSTELPKQKTLNASVNELSVYTESNPTISNRARKVSQSPVKSIKSKIFKKCEIHSQHLLEIICKNSACQKYVCYECVAFGDHKVG